MNANPETIKSVHEMLRNYSQAYYDKNLEGMMQLFAPDTDLVAIGSGRDEWVKGPEELKNGFKRDMLQAENIKADFEDVTISSSGNVAWASARMAMSASVDGKETTIFGRLSIVLEKRENKWLFTHLHFSVPSEDQKEGKSFPE